MPQIPEITLSTRKLNKIPDTIVARPVSDHSGDIIAQGVNNAGRSFLGMADTLGRSYIDNQRLASKAIEMQIQADNARINREADYLLAQWKDHTRKGIYGDVIRNPDGTISQIKGINQRTWADYEGTEKSALSDLSENQREWENSDPFKKADQAVINLFKRRAMPYRQAYIEAVNGMHDRNVKSKIIYQRKAMDASDDADVMMAAGSDNASFLNLAVQTSIRKSVREFQPLVRDSRALENPEGTTPDQIKLASPEYDDMFRRRVADHVYDYASKRITYLTQSAAKGEVMNDAAGTTPEQALAISRSFVSEMTKEGNGQKDYITPRQKEQLNSLISAAERGYKSVMSTRAVNYSDAAIKNIYANNPEPDKIRMQDWVTNQRNVADAIDREIVNNPLMKFNTKARDSYRVIAQKMRVSTVGSARSYNQASNENMLESMLDMGVVLKDDGAGGTKLESVNNSEAYRMILDAAASGTISPEGYRKLTTKARGKISDDNLLVLNEVLGEIPELRKHMYKSFKIDSDGQVALAGTKITQNDDTGMNDWYLNDRGNLMKKKVLFGQMLALTNAVFKNQTLAGASLKVKKEALRDALMECTNNYNSITIERSIENEQIMGAKMRGMYIPKSNRPVFFSPEAQSFFMQSQTPKEVNSGNGKPGPFRAEDKGTK